MKTRRNTYIHSVHGEGNGEEGIRVLRKKAGKYRYRVRGNEMGLLGQRKMVRARGMSKYKNKQGSQGHWKKCK